MAEARCDVAGEETKGLREDIELSVSEHLRAGNARLANSVARHGFWLPDCASCVRKAGGQEVLALAHHPYPQHLQACCVAQVIRRIGPARCLEGLVVNAGDGRAEQRQLENSHVQLIRRHFVGLGKVARTDGLACRGAGQFCAAAAAGSLQHGYQHRKCQDGGRVELAMEKAKAAALFRRSTKVFQDGVAGGGEELRLLRLTGAILIDGGVPIVEAGKLIGAIGVSVGSGEQDGTVAKADASAVR